MKKNLKTALILLALFSMLYTAFPAEKIYAIPYKQDPPIMVDGELDAREWAEIPSELKFERVEQVCNLSRPWKSVADLSGTVKLAWRPEGLYIGANVIDDKFLQKSSGDKAYCDDHLEIYLDMTPSFDKARDKFGDGQYQIVLNPGDLSSTFSVIKAEAVMFFPTVKTLNSVKVYAKKTDGGWVLEALIPWSELGVETVERGKLVGIDVVISDTDELEGSQEKIMFAGKAPWTWGSRSHLLTAVLTDSSGTIPDNVSVSEDIVLFQEITLKGDEKKEFEFNCDDKNRGVTVLQFKGRLDSGHYTYYAGYAATVSVSVNGKPVTPSMLINKPAAVTTEDGKSLQLVRESDNALIMPYLPNYKAMPKFGDSNYQFRDDFDLCTFQLEISKLVQPGKNTVVFEFQKDPGYDIHAFVNDAMIFNAGLFQTLSLKGDEKKEFKFNYDAKDKGVAVLQFNGRLDSTVQGYSGYASTICTSVNGKPVTPDMLINKPATISLINGQTEPLMNGKDNTLLMLYLPDYKLMPKFPGWEKCLEVNNYPFRDDIDFCLFQLEIAELVKPGENTIVFESRNKSKNDICAIMNNAMIIYTVKSARRVPRSASSGKIPTFVPKTDFKTVYSAVEVGDGVLSVNVSGEEYKLKTRFSIPEGKWVTDSNKYFRHERKLDKKAELMIVNDIFINLSSEDLPLMQHYEITVPSKQATLTQNGLEVSSNLRSYVNHLNSSSYGASGKTGLGIFPLNDEFRVHAENYVVSDNEIGIADRYMVLRPGITYTSSLAVIPTADASYWTFINALRRELDVNFKIDGGLGYMGSGPASFLTYALKSDWEKLNKIQEYYNPFFVWVDTPPGKKHKENLQLGPFGTDVLEADFSVWKNSFTKARKARPDAKILPYYHCFIDTSETPPKNFSDAATLDKIGNPVVYGTEPSRLYVPTLDNEFGKMQSKIIERYYKELDIDGIYWDEFIYSGTPYSYNPKHWDGCSADIDQKTFQIEIKKSSVELLSNDFRLKMVRDIKNHGKRNWLMVNSNPRTREIAAEKILSFTEAEQIINCTRMQVYCPLQYGIGSGSNELGIYRGMLKGLDYGVVHYWPPEWMITTHPTLSEFMFPITPIEIHKGFIIGEERIVTKESGIYGWNDSSAHEVHVYDNTGWERPEFKAPFKTMDGKTLTELRLPEDWSAVIVRKK